jgi:prepilin-type N-terminal cleavage/methylation domain-containing protein
MMKINTYKRGFTLIELLVVIAIIGILASVVLASLNTARDKGANAAIKSNLNNLRAQAELVYDTAVPNSYAAVCADPNVLKAVTAAATAGGKTVGTVNAANTTSNVTCYNATATWVVQATLKVPDGTNAYWCVDSTGTSKGDNAAAAANATVCP